MLLIFLFLNCLLITSVTDSSLAKRSQNHPKSEDIDAGKKIYDKGISSTNRIIYARLSGQNISASNATCTSCHGPEGGGGIGEMNITIPDITYSALLKSYGRIENSTPDNEQIAKRAFIKVVTLGFGKNGTLLHDYMPRYQLTLKEIDQLWAYIKSLDTVHADTIKEQN